jgi:four helix bundle protein
MGLVASKSYQFAINVISIYKALVQNKKEFVMSKQLLRSGTAIGALIREADHAQSKADFLNKMSIALKEANETEYWLMLLRDTFYITEDEFCPLHKKCDEILSLLVSIVKTTKISLNR